MHVYTIDKSLRGKVTLNIFILSIVLSSLLTFGLGGIITNVKVWLQQYTWISDILELCDELGVTTNFIGVTFLYGFIYWLFDNHIWKCKLLRRVLKVPDLNEHWEGNLTSTTQQTTIYMDLGDDNHLFGRYFNNRDNNNVGNKGGNIGTFDLHRINNRMKDKKKTGV